MSLDFNKLAVGLYRAYDTKNHNFSDDVMAFRRTTSTTALSDEINRRDLGVVFTLSYEYEFRGDKQTDYTTVCLGEQRNITRLDEIATRYEGMTMQLDLSSMKSLKEQAFIRECLLDGLLQFLYTLRLNDDRNLYGIDYDDKNSMHRESLLPNAPLGYTYEKDRLVVNLTRELSVNICGFIEMLKFIGL